MSLKCPSNFGTRQNISVKFNISIICDRPDRLLIFFSCGDTLNEFFSTKMFFDLFNVVVSDTHDVINNNTKRWTE